jgi:hypothetical protein
MIRSAPAQPGAPISAAQVRGVLARLHDPGALATHPLAALAGDGRGLRRALEEALDALKPARGGRPAPQVGRRHELLRLRYLEGLAVEEVQRRLLIGHAEYYRAHAQALGRSRRCSGPGSRPALRPATPPCPRARYPERPTGSAHRPCP